jgi:hypothetical protein
MVSNFKQVNQELQRMQLDFGRIYEDLNNLRVRMANVTGASATTSFGDGGSGATGTITAGDGLSGGGTLPGVIILSVNESFAFQWANIHTHSVNVVLDDGSGDSPMLQLVGGTNDDTVSLFLDDDAVSGQSDLVIRLADAAGQSQAIIQDSGSSPVAAIDSNGNFTLDGNVDGVEVGSHAHTSGTGGTQLDWDTCWADAVHDHSAAGEGGTTIAATSFTGVATVSAAWQFNENVTVDTATLQVRYDGSNYADFDVDSGGTLELDVVGNIILDPAQSSSGAVYPGGGIGVIEDDLGAYNRMWRTLYAAELYVETLVAQDVLATIGGRIMVAPTTYLTTALDGTQLILNEGFETLDAGADVFEDWDDTGLVVAETVNVRTGTYACSLQYTIGVSAVYTEGSITTVGSTRYTLEFWTRGDGTEQGGYALWDVTNSNWILNATDTGVTGTTYAQVSYSFTTPSNTVAIRVYLLTLYVSEIETEHNNLSNNDYVIMKAAPGGVAQTEVMQIESAAGGGGPYSYDVDRMVDGTPANSWVSGDALANLGYAAGEGYIDIASTSTVHNDIGPVMMVYARTATTTWDSSDPVVAVGNLNNLVDYAATDEFGFAVGNDLDLTPSTGFAGVTIDRTDGARLFNVDMTLYYGSSATVLIESEGNVFFGQDVSDPSYTGFAFFGVSQSWGDLSETMGAGDVLFGVNETGNANILWDESAGQLLFRTGVTTHCYVDTDGAFTAGGGDVTVDDDGITLLTKVGTTDTSNVKFYHPTSAVYIHAMTSYSAATTHTMRMGTSVSPTAYHNITQLFSRVNAASYDASVELRAENANTGDDTAVILTTDLPRRLAVTVNQFRLDQETEDSHIIDMRSTGSVAHGITVPMYSTASFGSLHKFRADYGGLMVKGALEGSSTPPALNLIGYSATTAQTTKATNTRSLVEIAGYETSGTDVTNATANAAIFGVRTQVGGSSIALLLVDEDGDLWSAGGHIADLRTATEMGLDLRSTGSVAHGITSAAAGAATTNTFCDLGKFDDDYGGVRVSGYKEGSSSEALAMALRGLTLTALDTTPSTSARGIIEMQAFLCSGNDITTSTDDGVLWVVRTRRSGGTETVALIDENGDLFLDGVVGTPFDEYNDVGLLHGLKASLMPDGHELRERFGEWIDYARPVLESTGVVHYNDGPGEDGKPFVSLRGMQYLTIDAVRQLYDRMMRYEEALLQLGVDVKMLD